MPEVEKKVTEPRQAAGGWFGTGWAWILFLVLVLLMMGTWGGQFWGV